MCDSSGAIDRRTALVGAGCLALGGLLPGGAAALFPGGAAAQGRRPRQSPIDLRRGRTTFVDRLPKVSFRYPERLDVTLVNTGSPDDIATVRADVPAGEARLFISGRRWDLVQFHWHTPSEHEVDGRKTPLEMHLVHSRADGRLLVAAVFIERGRANRALGPLFRRLPPQPGETRDVADARLRDLLPGSRRSFRYSGSLTTPPFTEPVRFVVFADPLEASRRQIGRFQEVFPDGNAREVQRLNGRRVLSDARR
jgi:carbonic anhydrase